jgi:ice-binding like protein/Big-like domain-containing protein
MKSKSLLSTPAGAVVLLALASACGQSSPDSDPIGRGGFAGSAVAGSGGVVGHAGAAGSGVGGSGHGLGGSASSVGGSGAGSGSAGYTSESGGAAGTVGDLDSGVPELADAAADALAPIPVVASNVPADSEVAVALNRRIRASFSEPMDPDTLNTSSFTLTAASGDAAGPIEGTVSSAGSSVVFVPDAPLAPDTEFVATITTAATSALGAALAADFTWGFITGNQEVPGNPVELGTAGDYVILAKTAISTVPTSAVTGDMAISPAAASFITGFPLTADGTTRFSTSPQVIGNIFAANFGTPTPANLTAAVGDMELAFTDAAGRAPGVTQLGSGNIGGLTLQPGVYKWTSAVTIPSNVTLNGSATAVWIFQIAQDLTLSNGVSVGFTGGGLPQNVFWQVSGAVHLGTTAHLEGVALSQTAITLATGASVTGRLLAQTAVTLDANAVTEPTP